MEIRQIPISTSSVRVGIQDIIGNAVKNISAESIIKTAKAVSKSLADIFKKLLFQLAKLVVNLLNLLASAFSSTASSLKRKTKDGEVTIQQSRRIRRPSKKLTKILLYLGIAGITIFGLAKLAGSIGRESAGSSNRVEVKGAKATQDINRELAFPLKNGNDEEVSKIKYFIEKSRIA